MIKFLDVIAWGILGIGLAWSGFSVHDPKDWKIIAFLLSLVSFIVMGLSVAPLWSKKTMFSPVVADSESDSVRNA